MVKKEKHRSMRVTHKEVSVNELRRHANGSWTGVAYVHFEATLPDGRLVSGAQNVKIRAKQFGTRQQRRS